MVQPSLSLFLSVLFPIPIILLIVHSIIGFIFAVSMTSRIAPISAKFYVIRDDDGGAYFFEESDLKSKDPTKSFYYMTTDDYKGSGELVSSDQVQNQYSSYAKWKNYESKEDEDQNKSAEQLNSDIYGILNKLKGLKLLASNNEATQKPQYKLIPGDFQTLSQNKEKVSAEKSPVETFMGLPTSHLSAIMKLLDDFVQDRDETPVERTFNNNVELNPGIPTATDAPLQTPDSLVKKLQQLVSAARKSH